MNNPLEVDMIAGSQLRDTQGEMLSVEGADISDLESGKGRFNDNHGKGFFNAIGRITSAKKIYSEKDCSDPRHLYYWHKVKSPFIYVRGFLYNDEDHPNAKAAAAILRNIHKSDCPLKLKASVEGGVIARGLKDPNMLQRTKIHSVALTFTPANQATLVEPVNLIKSENWKKDKEIIKSVEHLAKTDIPSFRHITRRASAEKLMENLNKIKDLASLMGIDIQMPYSDVADVVHNSIVYKLKKNIQQINSLIKDIKHVDIDKTDSDEKTKLKKAITAGYGGAGSPMHATGGSVIQSESVEDGFKYITCKKCGHEQVHMANQVRCRDCKKSLSFSDLLSVMI